MQAVLSNRCERDKRRYEPGIGRSKLSVATTERQDRHPEVRIAVRHGILGQEAARFPEPRGITPCHVFSERVGRVTDDGRAATTSEQTDQVVIMASACLRLSAARWWFVVRL